VAVRPIAFPLATLALARSSTAPVTAIVAGVTIAVVGVLLVFLLRRARHRRGGPPGGANEPPS
jgi:membrane protein implicated in regulation of membrane protease activity